MEDYAGTKCKLQLLQCLVKANTPIIHIQPKKDKILQKHEFSGNKAIDLSAFGNAGGSGPSSRGGDRGRGGRGRGRGAGRGRGRGRGTGDGGDAKERAWKDKNKASTGNHNRKRGHDKKMARAGPL